VKHHIAMMHQGRAMKQHEQQNRRSNKASKKHKKKTLKEFRGGAKLPLFCKRVGSFFMKLLLKEVLKKLLRGCAAQNPN
jgi:hypothetical protein